MRLMLRRALVVEPDWRRFRQGVPPLRTTEHTLTSRQVDRTLSIIGISTSRVTLRWRTIGLDRRGKTNTALILTLSASGLPTQVLTHRHWNRLFSSYDLSHQPLRRPLLFTSAANTQSADIDLFGTLMSRSFSFGSGHFPLTLQLCYSTGRQSETTSFSAASLSQVALVSPQNVT